MLNSLFKQISVADEIEKELVGALPCGDDMVRVERLRGSVLKSAACLASETMRD